MRGIKPNAEIWSKVNQVIKGESLAVIFSTFISALCQQLIHAGVSKDENEARVHFAAMILSPDDSSKVGSLLEALKKEFKKLDDGKWLG